MNINEALGLLESLGNSRVRSQNLDRGAQPNQYGVKMGDIRSIATKIKTDHLLGLQLWNTGNADAMLLATLILKPKELTAAEVEMMTEAVVWTHIADWLMTNVIKLHPSKETLRLQWMESEVPMLSRAGWSLTAERIVKNPAGLDFAAILHRVEKEMPRVPPEAQWTMNYCLAEIGITSESHRAQAIAIGEKLGIYRDYPVSKGCTSPFAPAWINAIVGRNKN